MNPGVWLPLAPIPWSPELGWSPRCPQVLMVIPEPWVNVKGYTVLPREGNFSVLEVETPALPHTPATLLHTWLVLGAQTDLDETLTL